MHCRLFYFFVQIKFIKKEVVKIISKDKWFYFTHGKHSSSIHELKEVVEEMKESDYAHHVNKHKSDFADWVEHVFKENELAQQMRATHNKKQLLKVLKDFLRPKHKIKTIKTQTEEPVQPVQPVSKQKTERELSENQIHQIVEEARNKLEEDIYQSELSAINRLGGSYSKYQHNHFVVKEFVYGFVLGLIFGLIMLGIIIRLGL